MLFPSTIFTFAFSLEPFVSSCYVLYIELNIQNQTLTVLRHIYGSLESFSKGSCHSVIQLLSRLLLRKEPNRKPGVRLARWERVELLDHLSTWVARGYI
jgi:hypothetical protein